MTTDFRLASTVLGSPNPPELAAFYVALLGWRYRDDDAAGDPDWIVIKPPPGGGEAGLSFQREENHVPPAWPAGSEEQQMQLHLDIAVGEDLDGAVARAEELGATQAEYQPQPLVRVMLDPAGHPFCLFAPGG
ncbi:hypothetical protein FB561_5743 [Kribbella amoyensis]|uniref:VOC domain-containing protein n=1 Tax=Kribbella amoyensis TaxID=996641 RepID=A0A561C087_9ACTN|nr:VOC family protein [Kribbella amoyensis]TWD84551.1 hypothetical protein FB561_5743 [Kribbella amoyensis]